MDTGGVATAYQREVVRQTHARLAAAWQALESVDAIEARLLAGAPPWPIASDADRKAWLDTIITTAATGYAAPSARDVNVAEALAQRFAELVTVAAVALAAARGDIPAPDTVTLGQESARRFLASFPAATFPLVAGDAFNPRAEYRDAVSGAYAIVGACLTK
jgi:hypothetical protein